MLDVSELAAPYGSSRRIVKEIVVPKIEVMGLGDNARNVDYKTGPITYKFETKTFNYGRGIKPLSDVMGVEEAGVLGYFVVACSELQRAGCPKRALSSSPVLKQWHPGR